MDLAANEVDAAQCQRALERANRVRTARAQVKRRIAAGELTAAGAVLSPRWEIERMRIGELIISQPGWGRQRCQEFLIAVAIDETKTIGSMTERQRIAAAAQLRRGQPTRRSSAVRPHHGPQGDDECSGTRCRRAPSTGATASATPMPGLSRYRHGDSKQSLPRVAGSMNTGFCLLTRGISSFLFA